MIRAYVANASEVGVKLDALNDRTRKELSVGIGRLALRLSNMVKQDKLSGQVLGKRTGRLRNSIHDAVAEEGDKVVGIVSTNVIYGIGWELGWPDGGPGKPSLKDAKSKFSLAGSDTFKNGTPKKRSFLGTALKDLESSGLIRSELDAAVARAVA